MQSSQGGEERDSQFTNDVIAIALLETRESCAWRFSSHEAKPGVLFTHSETRTKEFWLKGFVALSCIVIEPSYPDLPPLPSYYPPFLFHFCYGEEFTSAEMEDERFIFAFRELFPGCAGGASGSVRIPNRHPRSSLSCILF
ncbi:hypothetical protein T265_07804 [Opisthorchis viverrini]|uniref:Uncharacterized protein n=1 Tax=Opisthorchis viverrini TaxID=6198 RepID=A0A074ZME6_OPIVI|nr:hypothetical protein T265_07804 [Opisthorchis viverrini]KER24535.1 hypothetical protein T265_07804 [Opisthorchis viverrini]